MSNKSERDQIVEDLLKEYPIFELVEFNEFTISDKLKDHAYVLMKYQDLLNSEKYNLERIDMLYDKVKGERYHHYKFEFDEALQKNEIEQYYLPSDDKLLKIKALQQKQKIRVQFFEAAVNAIAKQGWNMRNWIESHKVL